MRSPPTLTSFDAFLDVALWAAGAGNFLVLASGFQVPRELRWRTELLKMEPLQRKVTWSMWTLTVLTLVGFGCLTLILHDEFLLREKAAVGLGVFAAAFWVLRLLLDIFYYRPSDWPRGRRYAFVHILLLLLWIHQSVVYVAYTIWALRG